MNHTAETDDSRGNDAVFVAAKAGDVAIDQGIRDALSAADADGALVSHDFATACSLGLWHTGECES